MAAVQPRSAAPRTTRTGSRCVVVLYEHPLLGEGVARLVRAATGARVIAVPGDDVPTMTDLLAASPRVVIVERGRLLDALDLAVAAPAAAVIELSGAGREPLPGRPTGSDEVIAAVQRALAPRRRPGGSRRA